MDRAVDGTLKRLSVPPHLVVAASAWISRIVAAAAQLLVLRILLPYLGASDYALFSVVTSLATWFALVEFGVGNSLQNRISEARATGTERATVIRSAAPLLIALFCIATILLVIGGPALQHYLFRNIVNGHATNRYLVAIVGLIYVVTNLANVSFRVFYGEMRGYVSNVYVSLGNVFGLAVVAASRLVPTDDSARLAIALVGWTLPPAIIGIISAVHAAREHSLADTRPAPELTRLIWSRAWRFGGFAAMSAAVLGIDYIVMSQALPPEMIVQYNAVAKVYGLIFFIYSSLLQATWPVCAEAFGRSDFARVRSITMSTLIGGVAVVAGGTIVFIAARQLVAATLLGSQGITIPASLIVAFGVYFLIRVWSDTFAMILMSRDRLRIFWQYVPFQAAISAAGQITLAPRYGAFGILAGLMLSFLLTAAWVLPMEYARITRRVGGA